MRRVYLSQDKKLIAGVCGGLSDAFNFDVIAIRLLCVFIALVTSVFPAVIVYVIAWAVLPEKPIGNVTDTAWSSE